MTVELLTPGQVGRRFGLFRPPAAGGGGFDPLSISWDHAYWAEGAEFVALGLADGAAVSNLPDEVSTFDAVQASGSFQPTYRAALAAFNSQPAVQSDGVNDLLRTSAWAALTQPNTLVVVGASGGASKILIDGIASGNRQAIYTSAAPAFLMYSGTNLTDGAADTAAHLFICTFNGGSSTFELDGDSVASGNAGTHTLTGLTLMDDYNGGQAGGTIAFAAVINGTLTPGEKADLLAWSQSHYGTP